MSRFDGTPVRWVVWSASVAAAVGALWCLWQAAQIATQGWSP